MTLSQSIKWRSSACAAWSLVFLGAIERVLLCVVLCPSQLTYSLIPARARVPLFPIPSLALLLSNAGHMATAAVGDVVWSGRQERGKSLFRLSHLSSDRG